MLAERLVNAIGVLGSDDQVSGSIREQASIYLGEPVDNQCITFMEIAASTTYRTLFEAGMRASGSGEASQAFALIGVLVTGMALGKRLGIEDGEQFARQVGDPE
jgi:hypothetical protein